MTGIIVSIPPAVEAPPGSNSSNPNSLNTYKTRGLQGSILKSDMSGGFIFSYLANASADNPSITQLGTLTPASMALGSPTGGGKGAGSINISGTYHANGVATGSPFTLPAATTSGSGSNTTGTISAASPTLTLAAAIDFANGQGIRVNHAGAAFALNPPTAASVTPTGTAGSTAYAYTIASLNATGGVGQSIVNVATATGNAALSSTNYNAISWTAATGTAPAAYAVYGRVAGSLVLLGIVTGTTFNDTGSAAITGTNLPDWLPAAPQTCASLASWLITTISSGAGTTTLTLAANAATAATSQLVIHDDTANLQAAITAAQTAGNTLYVGPGSYQVTSALNVTSRLTLHGAGYQGDGGQDNIGGFGSYNSAGNITSGSGWLGTTFVCGVLNNCINVATNNAITFEKFQITYPARAVTGITGIAAAAAAGGTSNNIGSTFRDLFISGPDVGMSLANFVNFHVDHLTIAPWTTPIDVSVANYPSFGDSVITNCVLYGRSIAQGILVHSMGGLRIINNKIVSGTVGIHFLMNLPGNQLEPVVIANNSIEGQLVGIQFNQASGTTSASQIAITGNQIYVSTYGINVIRNGSNWLTAFTIASNAITFQSTVGIGIRLDGATLGMISANVIVNGLANGTGGVLSANTCGVNVQSNSYSSGLTARVTNGAGAANTVGGGSM
jgi:hypothetical protein